MPCCWAQQERQAWARSLALVVSGGHTHLYLTHQEGGRFTYRNVGATLDDAAGEAFDKVAKAAWVGLSGWTWIDALAPYGDPTAVAFAFAQVKQKVHRPEASAGRFPFPSAASRRRCFALYKIHELYPSIEQRRQALAAIPERGLAMRCRYATPGPWA